MQNGFGANSHQESASGDVPCPRRVAWVLVLVLVALTLGGMELALRAGLIWQVPLDYLLQRPGDRYTRAAWLIHHPPPPGPHDVVVLGSSTAAAVSELPHGESEHALRTLTGDKDLRLISLTGSGGCYPEHLTILENALAHGYRPHTVLLLSYPSCLGAYDETDALVAARMPMVSEALASLTSRDLTTEVRISAWLARTSALHRYRGMANAWLRERWEGSLRGRAYPWEAIAFTGDRRVSAWNGRLEGPAYRSVQAMGGSWRYTRKSAALLGGLLATARRAGARVLVVESPWSPPVFDALAPHRDTYFDSMTDLVTRGGGTYVDPNRTAPLSRDLFNDVLHVNHTGARAYLPVIASELRHALASD